MEEDIDEDVMEVEDIRDNAVVDIKLLLDSGVTAYSVLMHNFLTMNKAIIIVLPIG